MPTTLGVVWQAPPLREAVDLMNLIGDSVSRIVPLCGLYTNTHTSTLIKEDNWSEKLL